MKYVFYLLIWIIFVVFYVITWVVSSLWNFSLRGVSYSNYIKWWMGNTYTDKRGRYIQPPCPFIHLKWMMKYDSKCGSDVFGGIPITDYED